MADCVECEKQAAGFDAHSIRIFPQERAGALPEWREAKFPTREDVFIGLLALGVVVAVLLVAATILTA